MSSQASGVPETNESRVVIPSNSTNSGFYRNKYRPDLLGRLIVKEKFDEVINKSSKILSQNHSLRINLQKSPVMWYEKAMMLISCASGLGFLFM